MIRKRERERDGERGLSIIRERESERERERELSVIIKRERQRVNSDQRENHVVLHFSISARTSLQT